MAKCSNCVYADVITDEEYCKHLRCRKTSKKGRSIVWFMHCYNGHVLLDIANWCETHKTPSWCPLEREGKL